MRMKIEPYIPEDGDNNPVIDQENKIAPSQGPQKKTS
jgi:hypothetical protein